MITTLQMRIQSGTFRDHALEQGATVQELAEEVRARVLKQLEQMNFRAVAAAVLGEQTMTFQVTVRDPYADLPEMEEGGEDECRQ